MSVEADYFRKTAILVNDDGRAMLTDFGSCSVVWNPGDIPHQTIRWCAPEVLGSEKVSGTQPTCASDVFSFGMVILEVGLSGRGKTAVTYVRSFLDLLRKSTLRWRFGW